MEPEIIEQKSDKKKVSQRWNWESLKQEFIGGNISTVAEFFRQKGISRAHQIKTVGWTEERLRAETKALKDATEELAEDFYKQAKETRDRQARLSRYMQLKGMEKLKLIKPDELTPEDARKLMVTGMQEERKAIGLEGGVTQNQKLTQININTGPKTNLDKMLEGADYVEILQIIADLKRGSEAVSIESSLGESEGEVEEGEITGLLDVGERSVDDGEGEETGLLEEEVPSTSVSRPTPTHSDD